MAKVCLVCGLGGGGIGDHVAKKFASEGYKVALLARTKENLDKLESEIPNSKGYVCDASDSESVHAVVSTCIQELGGVDVLIYNAGSGIFKPFDVTTVEEFEQCWQSGPKGLFSFAKALTPHFQEKGSGVIGVTGATASWRGMPQTVAFASAKFAQRGLCQALSRDLGPKNIHCFHVIIDGVVKMPKTRGWMPNKPEDEFLDPAHIAETFWYLANQDKSCWTYELNVGTFAINSVCTESREQLLTIPFSNFGRACGNLPQYGDDLRIVAV